MVIYSDIVQETGYSKFREQHDRFLWEKEYRKQQPDVMCVCSVRFYLEPTRRDMDLKNIWRYGHGEENMEVLKPQNK